MINFILPHCFYNERFNRVLRDYIKTYPDRLNFNEKINIFAEQGGFPFSFWHGDINTNLNNNKDIFLYANAQEYSIKLNMPLILDFSNIYLDIYPLFIKDPHILMYLKVFENQGNYIKVSNENIKRIIQEQYPGYNFLLKYNSSNINENIINYDLVELSQNIEIQGSKRNIYFPLHARCFSCKNCQQCNEQENLHQFSFTKESVRNECSLIYPSVENSIDAYKQARKNGYTNFYFEDVPSKDIPVFNEFLIHFFIKPEFHKSFKEVPLK